MKQMFTATIALVAASSGAFVLAQQSAQAPEQQVRQTYMELVAARSQGDRATFDRIVADDALFVGFGPTARTTVSYAPTVETKAEVSKVFDYFPASKKNAAKKSDDVKNRRIVEIKVQGQGQTAVLVERVWLSDGKQSDRKINTTNVFAHHDDQWQLVSSSLSSD